MNKSQTKSTKRKNKVVIELPENTLNALLSPMAEAGSSGSGVQNSSIYSMMTGKNMPLPCYKRSNRSDQLTLRITAQYV